MLDMFPGHVQKWIENDAEERAENLHSLILILNVLFVYFDKRPSQSLSRKCLTVMSTTRVIFF